MNKVYLIGVGVGEEHIAAARVALLIPEDAQVVCVSKVEDIPIEDRMSLRPDFTQIEVHKLTLCERLPDPICWERPEKRKGYERPYKYHR